jgi:phage replication-related protein YjqB (UPF0714/DUF867 family)
MAGIKPMCNVRVRFQHASIRGRTPAIKIAVAAGVGTATMADTYKNFEALKAGEAEEIDYRIRFENRGTPVVVLAPHGGSIEPGSSQIAMAIAREDYSFYCFEGLGPDHYGDLHITSDHFDEPRAVKLVTAAETAIAIHGRRDRDDQATVWLGGRDTKLRDAVASSLRASQFKAATEGHPLTGRKSANICNRGTTGAGVQLELPRALRDRLVRDQAEMRTFACAVRTPLAAR